MYVYRVLARFFAGQTRNSEVAEKITNTLFLTHADKQFFSR